MALRWFAGYRLDEILPDHSSLTRIRHRWHVEGAHGRAKSYHGLRRAVRRGLSNIHIQSCLAATAMNLKKLAAHHPLTRLLTALHRFWNSPRTIPKARIAYAA